MDPIKKKFTDPKSVMFSNAWWSNLHKNWWQILLKLALFSLIFWLIWMAITPLISFNSYFKWFRKGGGNQYKNCFRFTQLAYYDNFLLYFYISQLINKGPTTIDTQIQAELLLYLLATYSDQLGLGNPLTPKALCESIIPDGVMSEDTRTAYNNGLDPTGNMFLTTRAWPPATSQAQWARIFYIWGAGGIPTDCKNISPVSASPFPSCAPGEKGGSPPSDPESCSR